MESLPPEILFKILRHIDHSDLQRLRLVNKWFGEQVTRQLNAISSIGLTRSYCSRISDSLAPFSCHFELEKLVVRMGLDIRLRNILPMVKDKFPALQAIDFGDLSRPIKLSYLTPFARHLKYFKASQIKVDVPYQSVKEIMDMFPALQAFDVEGYSEPFCPRMWSGRTNFTQWSNVCKHEPRCEKTGLPPATKCVELTEFSPRHLDLTPISSSLEVLILIDLDAVPPVLHLPELKHFRLSIYDGALETNMFLNFLANAPKVRQIIVDARFTKNSASLSLLSFVNSLPRIETIRFHRYKIIRAGDSDPRTFSRCNKPRLNEINLNMYDCDNKHFDLIKSLLDSSQYLSNIEIKTEKNIGLDVRRDYHYDEGSSLRIFATRPAHLKQLLEILTPRYCSVTQELHLSTKEGVDAIFVGYILTFKNLRKLAAKLTEEFIKYWQPLFSQLNNKKNIELDLCQHDYTAPSRETHDLMIESLKDGSVGKIDSRFLCSVEECTCGLLKEPPRYRL